MFNSIKNYAIAVLFVLTIGFGYMSYQMYGDNKVMEVEIKELKLATEKAEETRLKLIQSCKITEAVLDSFHSQTEGLSGAQQRDLEALSKRGNPTPQPTQEKRNETTTDSFVVPRNGQLDSDLKRLLDRAYCEGARNDPYCNAKTTP